MNVIDIPLGTKGTKQLTVTEKDTAASYGSGLVPVFATPALVALMENTAQESILTFLPPGHSTVGIHLDIRHVKPTPVGMTVTCESTLIAANGSKLIFEMVAHDEQGIIGKGNHTRYIVETESFLKLAGLY
jgi:predicted thioesterase